MSLAHQIQPNGIAARAMAARGAGAIPIEIIRIDGGTQSRALLQDSVIEEYAAAIKEGVEFPPVVLFYDGADHWLADGFHRVRAFLAAGLASIPADVRQGTRRDAILYSVGANEAHGLRRTNDDKRRAVLTLLNDGEWAKWSDGEIARRCFVSQPFVSKLRPATQNVMSDRTYTTKHGTVATMNTAAIGKTKEEDMEAIASDRPVQGSWVKINVPEGIDIIDLCRRGLALEADGVPSMAGIADELGIAERTYATLRQIVLLADNTELSARDREIAQEAIRLVRETQQVSAAWEVAEPLAVRVWGEGKRVDLLNMAEKRLERFERSFGIILQTCMTTNEVDLPYLSADRAKKAIRDISTARGALLRFAERIKEIHG